MNARYPDAVHCARLDVSVEDPRLLRHHQTLKVVDVEPKLEQLFALVLGREHGEVAPEGLALEHGVEGLKLQKTTKTQTKTK